MYMYVVFVIIVYYLIKKYIYIYIYIYINMTYIAHVSNACDTCKVFKDCLLFIKTNIFSHCKCFGYA